MRLRRGSRFKVQSSKFKVKGLRGLCPDALESSRFSDLKVQSDLRVDDKVQGSRSERPRVDDKVL